MNPDHPSNHRQTDGTPSTESDVAHLIDDAVNPRRKILLAVVGGIGLVEAVGLTTMVATEPEPLPLATTAALLTIAAAGLSWAVLAAWRLTRREILLLPDRVAATTLGLFWSTVATAGGMAIAVDRGQGAAAAAIGATGATLVVIAGVLMMQALTDLRRTRARLAALTGP